MIAKAHKSTESLVKAFTERIGGVYARHCYQQEIRQEKLLAKYVGSEDAVLFNCGMAAITTAIRTLNLHGLALISETLYSQTKRFLEELKEKEGAPIQFINPTQYDWTAIPSVTSLIFVETIGNGFEMPVADIPAIMEMVKGTGTLLIVDNTFLTPYLFNPIETAKEKGTGKRVLTIESATKYYQKGTNAITVGIVYGPKKKMERIKKQRTILGTYLQPTSIEYFPIEVSGIHKKVMPRHSENALKLAQYLEQHPKVEQVRYPLLESHPQHELAQELFLNGCGGVFYFSLKDGPEAVTRFADNLPYGYISGSFGFANTRILPLGALQNNGVVRVAAGFEDHIEQTIQGFKKALREI